VSGLSLLSIIFIASLKSLRQTDLLVLGNTLLQPIKIEAVSDVLRVNLDLRWGWLTETKNSCPSRSQNQSIQPASLLLSESYIFNDDMLNITLS
jgi:hypothetical protein